MKRQIFPTASKYRRRNRREFGGETVEYIIVILASIVFDNELSDIPQGNITYRWFKCAGLGSGAPLVAKELGSSPSLSLSGLQGSYINCEVTLTVNGKSKTFVPKAICNGKLSDGIYVRPRIG